MSEFQIGKNGLYAEKQNDLFEGVVKVEGDPHAAEIAERIRLKTPKIPRVVFDRACAFIRWCKEEHKSEGMVAFVWKRGQWDLACPHQWNSGGGICYHPEITGDEFLAWRGDIHGHPGESSCHSGTDHGDEKKKRDGIFIVVGVPFDIAHATATAMFHDRHFTAVVSDVVDVGGPPGDGTFPEEWKFRFHDAPCEACKKPEPSRSETRSCHESDIYAEWLRDKERRDTEAEMGELGEMAAVLFENERKYGLEDAKIFDCKCGESSDHVLCPECMEPMASEDVFRAVAQAMGEAFDFYSIHDPLEKDPEKGGDLSV